MKLIFIILIFLLYPTNLLSKRKECIHDVIRQKFKQKYKAYDAKTKQHIMDSIIAITPYNSDEYFSYLMLNRYIETAITNPKSIGLLCYSIIQHPKFQECPLHIKIIQNSISILGNSQHFNEVLQVIRYLVEYNSKESSIYIQENIANSYYQFKQYDLAIKHFSILLEKKENLIERQKSSFNNNIALCYQKLKQDNLAIKHFKLAVKFANNIIPKNEYNGLYLTYYIKMLNGNILELSLNENSDNTNFYQYLKEEYELYKKLNNYKKSDLSILLKLLSYSIKLKKIEEANSYIELIQNRITASKSELKEKQLETYYHSLLQKSILEGEKKLALKLSSKLMTIQNENSREKFNYFRKTVNTDNSHITSLWEKGEQTISEHKQFERLLFVSIFVLCVLIFTIVISYRKLNIKDTKNQHQKLIIKKALKEKEYLIKEIHHRVKNNLQLISSIGIIENEKEEKFNFENFENKIISLSLVHEMLYTSSDLAHVYLEEYFQKLIHNLQLTSDLEFGYDLFVPSIELNLDKTIAFGLLINELITNSLKYCKPVDEKIHIHLELCKQKADVYFLYKDNGNEFVKNKSKNSLGLSLIDLFIEKLDGNLQPNRTNSYQLEVIFKNLT